MDAFLQNVGMISIIFAVLLAAKRVFDRADLRRAGSYEDAEEEEKKS
ncbi:hypothetical protein ['Paenibacillus yunnanensis' Narsing Rao et al. 2020]|nr:hypothetical protein [Paenibacillus tengchongensis]